MDVQKVQQRAWTVMETGELKVPIISYKGIKVPVL